MKKYLLFLLLVCTSAFAGTKTAPLVYVEFTILEPLLVETVTCEGWSQVEDFTQWGHFNGSKCTATGTIPDRTGSLGSVDASFELTSGGAIYLEGCRMEGVSGSGGSGSALITYTLNCS